MPPIRQIRPRCCAQAEGRQLSQRIPTSETSPPARIRQSSLRVLHAVSALSTDPSGERPGSSTNGPGTTVLLGATAPQDSTPKDEIIFPGTHARTFFRDRMSNPTHGRATLIRSSAVSERRARCPAIIQGSLVGSTRKSRQDLGTCEERPFFATAAFDLGAVRPVVIAYRRRALCRLTPISRPKLADVRVSPC